LLFLPRRGVRLENERYEEIKEDIIDMYEECDVHSFPLNAFDIASKLHYNVIPYSELPIPKQIECYTASKDGCSELDFNASTQMYEYNIYYNDTLGIEQSRVHFTIMHEIGHIRLGHLDDDADKDERFKESEANFYAAYSIAPPPMINSYDCSCPDDLGRYFNTSGEMSGYAFERYLKWLNCGIYYKDYEIHMMQLFGVA
jgi:hypothetical protein